MSEPVLLFIVCLYLYCRNCSITEIFILKSGVKRHKPVIQLLKKVGWAPPYFCAACSKSGHRYTSLSVLYSMIEVIDKPPLNGLLSLDGRMESADGAMTIDNFRWEVVVNFRDWSAHWWKKSKPPLQCLYTPHFQVVWAKFDTFHFKIIR